MRHFAVIGTRNCTAEQLAWMRQSLDLEKRSRAGQVLHTGAAPGIDQMAAEEWASRGGDVVLHLPWPSYEQAWVQRADRERGIMAVYPEPRLTRDEKAVVAQHHERWGQLSHGSRLLHFRNFGIVRRQAQVYAAPGSAPWGGGTAMGLKLALHFEIPIAVCDALPERRWTTCGCRT